MIRVRRARLGLKALPERPDLPARLDPLVRPVLQGALRNNRTSIETASVGGLALSTSALSLRLRGAWSLAANAKGEQAFPSRRPPLS